MLEKDFKLRPEYVAYATLIREFGNAVPAGELNVVRRSGSGWLQCFSGDTGAGKVNLLILNDAAGRGSRSIRRRDAAAGRPDGA